MPGSVVVVNGRVLHAPPNAKVRVQLVFAHKRKGESEEGRVEDSEFKVPVSFFTLSRAGWIGEWPERCRRKPRSVAVTLAGGDPSQEYDRLTLNLLSDFNETKSLDYMPKSEIVLKGPE
jgi:hypothetical protein